MKKILSFFLFFLILTSYSYSQDSLFDYRSLNLDMTLNSELELKGDSSSSLDYLIIKLFLYPETDFTQEVLTLSTNPKYTAKEDYLELMWSENRLGQYDYSLNSRIRTYNQFPIISKKISFPIGDLPKETQEYLEFTEKIDTNQEIIEKASELAEGEDDLYQVVFNLGKWTKENINYSITTLTAEASEPSSWVLDNKYGVCDELTNLFISFCRSLGIPARFVSGVSYSNSDEFVNNWGLHGWAEVYFPEYGWVSFDPTYAQFGYTDATHIKLKHSIDSDKSSTKFEWQAHNVNLEPGLTEIDVDILDYGKKLDKYLDIDIIPLNSEVGLSSFNLIEVKVHNLKNYYISSELIFSSSREVVLHDSRYKYILLGPNQEKSVYWIAEVDDLRKHYIYTFPIEIFDSFGYSEEGSFKAKEDGITYTFGQVWQIIKNIEEQESKVYSKNLDLNCEYPAAAYINQSFEIKCKIKNKGNVMLENLNVCLEDKCKKTELGITQQKNLSFYYIPKLVGEQEFTIAAKNIDVTKTAQLRIVVEDFPNISISNILYPELLEYGPDYNLIFEIHKNSLSIPKDVRIKFRFNNKETDWFLEELDSIQKFNVGIDKSLLNVKDNRFQIIVEYHDKDNKIYTESYEKALPIKEPNLWQKILIWINKLTRDLEKLFS